MLRRGGGGIGTGCVFAWFRGVFARFRGIFVREQEFFNHFIRLPSTGGMLIQGVRGVMGITGWGNCKSTCVTFRPSLKQVMIANIDGCK